MPTVQVCVLCTNFHEGFFIILPSEKTKSTFSPAAFQAKVLIADEKMPGQNGTYTFLKGK